MTTKNKQIALCAWVVLNVAALVLVLMDMWGLREAGPMASLARDIFGQ